MSILLYFNEVVLAGRLHRARWADSIKKKKSNPCTLSFVSCKRHTFTHGTHTRARSSLRCVCLLLCLPNTKGICARVCAWFSLSYFFWESFVYQKEFFFKDGCLFDVRCDLINDLNTEFSCCPWHRFFPISHSISDRKFDFSSMNFIKNGRPFHVSENAMHTEIDLKCFYRM